MLISFSVKLNFHFTQKSDAVMVSKDPEAFSKKLSQFPASKVHISFVKFPGDSYMKLFKMPNLKVRMIRASLNRGSRLGPKTSVQGRPGPRACSNFYSALDPSVGLIFPS